MASGTGISGLAAEVGLRPSAIRYYERVGLLPEPARSASGYRRYGPDAAGRLRFIAGAQRLGLRLREIRELLEIRDRGLCPCGHTRELVRRRIAELKRELDSLQRMRRELARMARPSDERKGSPPGTWSCRASELLQIER